MQCTDACKVPESERRTNAFYSMYAQFHCAQRAGDRRDVLGQRSLWSVDGQCLGIDESEYRATPHSETDRARVTRCSVDVHHYADDAVPRHEA
jgi:hypothetical protein